jgi:hypothetical protein
VYVSAKDEAERQVDGQGVVRVVSGDIRLSVEPEGYVAEPGRPMGVVVRARDHDGKPVAGLPVAVEARSGRYDAKTDRYEETPAGTQTATTGADGAALVTITPAEAGELALVARANDTRNRPVRARAYLWAASDGAVTCKPSTPI